MFANLPLVEEQRLRRLLQKPWVGQQLEKFWRSHGFHDINKLAEQSGLTTQALNNYTEAKSFPGWPALVRIANACKTDVAELVRHLDPGEALVNEEKASRDHKLLDAFHSLTDKTADFAIRLLEGLRDLQAAGAVSPRPGKRNRHTR